MGTSLRAAARTCEGNGHARAPDAVSGPARMVVKARGAGRRGQVHARREDLRARITSAL
jgi:hypothetical protein